MSKVRVRSTAKFSIFLSIVLMILLIGGYFVFNTFLAKDNIITVEKQSSKMYVETDYPKVFVDKGDTLYSIAYRNLPSGRNINDYIQQIKYHNNMSSSDVYIGEAIYLPLS